MSTEEGNYSDSTSQRVSLNNNNKIQTNWIMNTPLSKKREIINNGKKYKKSWINPNEDMINIFNRLNSDFILEATTLVKDSTSKNFDGTREDVDSPNSFLPLHIGRITQQDELSPGAILFNLNSNINYSKKFSYLHYRWW